MLWRRALRNNNNGSSYVAQMGQQHGKSANQNRKILPVRICHLVALEENYDCSSLSNLVSWTFSIDNLVALKVVQSGVHTIHSKFTLDNPLLQLIVRLRLVGWIDQSLPTINSSDPRTQC